jgi:hypothetical protein
VVVVVVFVRDSRVDWKICFGWYAIVVFVNSFDDVSSVCFGMLSFEPYMRSLVQDDVFRMIDRKSVLSER